MARIPLAASPRRAAGRHPLIGILAALVIPVVMHVLAAGRHAAAEHLATNVVLG